MHRVPVRKLMTESPLTIAPHLPVDVAIETMRANDVRRLPVVTTSGSLTGIITLYDALIATRTGDDWMGPVIDTVPTVKDAMTANVTTIGPDETVARAARVMVSRKVGALPVVDENHKMIGIITESDLFRYLADMLEPEEAEPAGG